LGKFEKKMKLLIVPTDFSPISDNATKYAMEMALALDAKIMLINMYQIHISFSEVPFIGHYILRSDKKK
jgi:hypothetical protein